MTKSQRVAQYISDGESDKDMELEFSNSSRNIPKRAKRNRRR